MACAQRRKGRTSRSRLLAYRPRIEFLEDRTLLSFITAPGYAAGISPVAVAVGDLNGDGTPDLVVANSTTSGTVSVLLGNGDGSFQAPVAYAVGSQPAGVAVADLTGDGRLDLVVANSGSNTVSVLRGNGDGTFQAAVSYAVGTQPESVAVGDFNSDGIPDLVTANYGISNVVDGSVSVLLGNGDGTFQAAATIATGSKNPTDVAVGAFDGDGDLDLAVSGIDDFNHIFQNPKVSVLLGNGDGSFKPPVSYAAGFYPDSVATGDLNGDGIPDLAVANRGSTGGTVDVLVGNGDGTFQAPISYAAGSDPAGVTVGDMTGDGVPDVAVLTAAGVSVYLNQGDGTLQAPATYLAGITPAAVALGDFNGDNIPDLAVVNRTYGLGNPGTVSILLGKGDNTFQAAVSYPTGGPDPHQVAVGDLNGDHIPDLVVVNYPTNTVGVLLGNGDGTFQAAHTYATDKGPTGVVIGDFTGDGVADLAVANFNGDTVSVLLGNGDGSFQAPVNYAAGFEPRGVTAADLTGDGTLDLLVPNGGGVNVLRGNGDGSFQAPVYYTVSAGASAVAVGDFNGDGIPDLATAGNKVSILLGNGDGSFQAPVTYAVAGVDATDVVAGDFTGTGHLDLAVPTHGTSTLCILLGNGDGTFQAAVNYVLDAEPGGVTVADFNGDGIADLTVTSFAGVSIMFGNGDGSFQAPALAAPITGAPAVGDFNGDGAPDLAMANGSEFGMVTILLNAADWGRAHSVVASKPRLPPHDTTASPRLRSDRLAPLAIGTGPHLVSNPLLVDDRQLPAPPPAPTDPEMAPPPGFDAPATAPLSFLARHGRDALVADGWPDSLRDALAQHLEA